MPQYVWICLTRTWVCLNMSEFTTIYRVLNMCRVLYISGFWIIKDCQYARVQNFRGYTGFTLFHKCDTILNMPRGAIMEGFWIFQDSGYGKFLHMQALQKVLNVPEFGWIWLHNDWINCSDYAAAIHLLKVNNRNTRTRCETCSKLTIKKPEQSQWCRSGVFIVNFEHISHLVVVFLLLTLNM